MPGCYRQDGLASGCPVLHALAFWMGQTGTVASAAPVGRGCQPGSHCHLLCWLLWHPDPGVHCPALARILPSYALVGGRGAELACKASLLPSCVCTLYFLSDFLHPHPLNLYLGRPDIFLESGMGGAWDGEIGHQLMSQDPRCSGVRRWPFPLMHYLVYWHIKGVFTWAPFSP